MQRRSGLARPSAMRCSATVMKSVKVFFLCRNLPFSYLGTAPAQLQPSMHNDETCMHNSA